MYQSTQLITCSIHQKEISKLVGYHTPAVKSKRVVQSRIKLESSKQQNWSMDVSCTICRERSIVCLFSFFGVRRMK